MNIDDDDFTLFALPERFAVDLAQLDRRWRELQAEVHPDRFAAQGTAAQRIALNWSVRVNQAYLRLKDPLKRAAYLCERRAAPVNAERNTAMPRQFLVQQMAWREALDDAQDGAAVQALQAQVAAHERALLGDLQVCFDERNDAPAAAEQLRELMFVARFRQDVERRLEVFES